MALSKSSFLITAVSCSAAAFCLILALRGNKSNRSTVHTSLVVRDDEMDPDNCIQAEDVISIFDNLYIYMQNVIASLSQQIQQIQQAGQSIPEKQLRQLLKAEFERALLAKQTSVFEEYDIDEDCLEAATWEFLQDEDKYPKVKKAVERFQTLYETITKEKVVGRRPGDGKGSLTLAEDDDEEEEKETTPITKEKTLEAAEAYFDALTNTMGYIVQNFKDEGKDFRDPMVAQQLQMQFAAVANDAGEDALNRLGVSLKSFRNGIEKYQGDPSVGRSLAMFQMKQQQAFMSMGLPDM